MKSVYGARVCCNMGGLLKVTKSGVVLPCKSSPWIELPAECLSPQRDAVGSNTEVGRDLK